MEPGADLPARRLALVIARVVLTLRHPALVARFAMKPGYLPNPDTALGPTLSSPSGSNGFGGLKTQPYLKRRHSGMNRFYAEALRAGCVARRRGEPRPDFSDPLISPAKRKKSRNI